MDARKLTAQNVYKSTHKSSITSSTGHQAPQAYYTPQDKKYPKCRIHKEKNSTVAHALSALSQMVGRL